MQIVKLQSLQFQQKSKRKAGEGKKSGIFKFFTSSNIQKKYIDEFDFVGPALIFGTGGSASVHFCDENFSTSTDCFILKSDNIDIDLKYIYYKLSGNINILEQGFKGAGLKHISKEFLSQIQIPLPPIQTQKQIIQKLDKLTHLIELRKQSIQKTEQLTKSIFIEIFGELDSYSKLGEVSKITMGQSPIGDSYNTNGIGSPLLNGPTEFGKINPIEKQYTTNPKKYSNIGDILFCVRGATAGKLNISDKIYCIGRGLASIRGTKINNEFIYYVLKSKYDYFQNIGQGSTFINISKDNLNDLIIPNPPLPLQNKFATIVQKNEENIKKQKESLAKLEELCNTTMQESFSF